MIPVAPQPAPADFDLKVKQKGMSFLAMYPHATAKMIQNNRLWKNAVDDIFRLYNGYCAYSAYLVPSLEIDHYIPIAKIVEDGERHRAYEWDNFRPASGPMNREKGDSNEIIDPFIIESGWFIIDFKTINLKIERGKNVPEKYGPWVDSTIRRLKLNNKFNYIEYRCKMLGTYCESCEKYPESIAANFENLLMIAPFIAHELQRQNLKEDIIKLWSRSQSRQIQK